MPEIGIEEYRAIDGTNTVAWGGTVPFGTWARLSMRILRNGAGGGTLTLQRDGTQVAQLPITTAAFPANAEVEVQVGVIFATTASVRLTTDDAIFDMK